MWRTWLEFRSQTVRLLSLWKTLIHRCDSYLHCLLTDSVKCPMLRGRLDVDANVRLIHVIHKTCHYLALPMVPMHRNNFISLCFRAMGWQWSASIGGWPDCAWYCQVYIRHLQCLLFHAYNVCSSTLLIFPTLAYAGIMSWFYLEVNSFCPTFCWVL